MKIGVQEAWKISAILQEVQSRAKERTLSAEEIGYAAEKAESRLDKAGLPACHRKGVRVELGHHKLPNSYKWRAAGTMATLERGRSRWYVVELKRDVCNYGRNRMILSDAQKEIIAMAAVAAVENW